MYVPDELGRRDTRYQGRLVYARNNTKWKDCIGRWHPDTCNCDQQWHCASISGRTALRWVG